MVYGQMRTLVFVLNVNNIYLLSTYDSVSEFLLCASCNYDIPFQTDFSSLWRRHKMVFLSLPMDSFIEKFHLLTFFEVLRHLKGREMDDIKSSNRYALTDRRAIVASLAMVLPTLMLFVL